MVHDLKVDDNKSFRLWKKLETESIAIVVAGISLFVAALSLFVAGVSIKSAIKADMRSEMQDMQIEQLSDDVQTYRFQVSLLEAKLQAGEPDG